MYQVNFLNFIKKLTVNKHWFTMINSHRTKVARLQICPAITCSSNSFNYYFCRFLYLIYALIGQLLLLQILLPHQNSFHEVWFTMIISSYMTQCCISCLYAQKMNPTSGFKSIFYSLYLFLYLWFCIVMLLWLFLVTLDCVFRYLCIYTCLIHTC